jgi:hypothetical protein
MLKNHHHHKNNYINNNFQKAWENAVSFKDDICRISFSDNGSFVFYKQYIHTVGDQLLFVQYVVCVICIHELGLMLYSDKDMFIKATTCP